MKIAVVSNNQLKLNAEQLSRTLCALDPSCELRFFTCSEDENIYSELSSFSPSILITENFAGFHMCTLMGSTVYNLLHALQLHIIYDSSLVSSSDISILKNPLSLSMHFLCYNKELQSKLIAINPDIPYTRILNTKSPCLDEISSMIKDLFPQSLASL